MAGSVRGVHGGIGRGGRRCVQRDPICSGVGRRGARQRRPVARPRRSTRRRCRQAESFAASGRPYDRLSNQYRFPNTTDSSYPSGRSTGPWGAVVRGEMPPVVQAPKATCKQTPGLCYGEGHKAVGDLRSSTLALSRHRVPRRGQHPPSV
ncbi:hypothetical protein BRADI_2g13032v3 [Brachypodium distachyon]|uniref:Uncharacterized protein n=1 Tax=Brachypodium distachyon TaxID=15368 RepID=A0A2K2D893_BRADI|nr:hypothetical protein BRADI_2g13032v3 [Brachypodium distachyon]